MNAMDLHQPNILKLNKLWQPIYIDRPVCVFPDLYNSVLLALNIEYGLHKDGTADFTSPINIEPVDWARWITLPIRSFDNSINTPNMKLRLPTVVVTKYYSKMPIKTWSLTLSNLWLRDKGICQYSNKKLSKTQASIDHVIPVSKGGQHKFTNTVLCDRNLNSFKSDRTPKEAGLTLLREPKEPNRIPVCSMIQNKFNIRDWDLFLINN
jgi:5-methylcytosine-specific restriction endonuclease McrA